MCVALQYYFASLSHLIYFVMLCYMMYTFWRMVKNQQNWEEVGWRDCFNKNLRLQGPNKTWKSIRSILKSIKSKRTKFYDQSLLFLWFGFLLQASAGIQDFKSIPRRQKVFPPDKTKGKVGDLLLHLSWTLRVVLILS